MSGKSKIAEALVDFPEIGESEIDEIDKRYLICALLNGFDENNYPFWAFINISPVRLVELRSIQASGEPYLLESYGEILNFGAGNAPPAEIMQEMRDKYNFDQDFERKTADYYNKTRAARREKKKSELLLNKIKEMKKKQDSNSNN